MGREGRGREGGRVPLLHHRNSSNLSSIHVYEVSPCTPPPTPPVPPPSLRPIDVEFMKHLHGFVNIVPVIAKADTLTIDERDSFKQRISEDLLYHGINIYPTAYGAEDEDDAASNAKIEVRVRPS